MSLLYVALVLIIIGFICWLIDTKIKMNETIKNILFGVIIIWVIWWLASILGVVGPPPLNIK